MGISTDAHDPSARSAGTFRTIAALSGSSGTDPRLTFLGNGASGFAETDHGIPGERIELTLA